MAVRRLRRYGGLIGAVAKSDGNACAKYVMAIPNNSEVLLQRVVAQNTVKFKNAARHNVACIIVQIGAQAQRVVDGLARPWLGRCVAAAEHCAVSRPARCRNIHDQCLLRW